MSQTVYTNLKNILHKTMYKHTATRDCEMKNIINHLITKLLIKSK